jgi:release factor glutamine methyltransferase
MPSSPVPLTESSVVRTLRAAGCVFAEDEARLLLAAAADQGELAAMIRRRTAGFPLEHILGYVEFCGLQLEIGAGVFVPRRRTELLAGQAINRTGPGDTVLDMCCGCGALGAAVASAVTGIEVYASDIDSAAVDCARRNLGPWGGRVFQGNLFEPLPAALRGRVDILVSNAPYVPSGRIPMMPPEARLHEPMVALDGGVDGLEIQRRVAAEAGQWLAPGGHVLVETSEAQAPVSATLFAEHGLRPAIIASDELDASVVVGTLG